MYPHMVFKVTFFSVRGSTVLANILLILVVDVHVAPQIFFHMKLFVANLKINDQIDLFPTATKTPAGRHSSYYIGTCGSKLMFTLSYQT